MLLKRGYAMNWIEVDIYTTSAGIDPVCGRLLRIGVTGFAIRDAADFEEFLNDKNASWDYIDDDLMNLKNCETCVTCYLADNAQGADMLSAVKGELDELRFLDSEHKFGRLVCELANVREEDWANNWKQYFKPLTVGEKLVIKPSWEEYENTGGRQILEIDPASSFGTGQHETTQLCLMLLEEYLRSGDRLLDLGCGSGILSIAAMLLGAQDVLAVDIDESSVKTAKENALKNNIPEEKYTALCGNIIGDSALRERIGTGYRIIAANIVADVLIAMSSIFGEFLAEGGVIIISGIITERCAEVMDAMEKNGFRRLALREADGWAAAAFEQV